MMPSADSVRFGHRRSLSLRVALVAGLLLAASSWLVDRASAECHPGPPGNATAYPSDPGPGWQFVSGTATAEKPAVISLFLFARHNYVFSLCAEDGGASFEGPTANSWLNLFDHQFTKIATNDDACGTAARIRCVTATSCTHKIVVTAVSTNGFGNGSFRLAYRDETPCADGSRTAPPNASVVVMMTDRKGFGSAATGTLVARAEGERFVPYVISADSKHGGQLGPYLMFFDGTVLEATWVRDERDMGLWRLPRGDYSKRWFYGWDRIGMPTNVVVRHYSRMDRNSTGHPNSLQYFANGMTLSPGAWQFDGAGENEWVYSGASGASVMEEAEPHRLYGIIRQVGGTWARNCSYPVNMVYDGALGPVFGDAFKAELGSATNAPGHWGRSYSP